MKTSFAILFFLSSFFCGSALVAAQYGMAGCGLGSLVITDKAPVSQVFAATTNGTSNSQTFGITSGTSNCGGNSSSSVAVLHEKVRDFMAINKVSLQNDLSRLEGETLASLNALMECDNSTALGKNLKQNYQQIFETDENARAANEIIDSVSKDQQIHCNFKSV